LVENSSMLIVCPHCTTSYAIDLATLGTAGRSVRCSRCQEVWLARPEDAVAAPAPVAAMANAGGSDSMMDMDVAAEWDALAEDDTDESPMVDSPPIAGWPEDALSEDAASVQADDPAVDEHQETAADSGKPPWFRRLRDRRASSRAGGRSAIPLPPLPALTAAMGALIVALLVWRADIVRLMPQTAAFYKMIALDVNLRGVAFRDLKVSTENVQGKPVLVIEGAVVSTNRKPVDLPRLRFSVRDAQGAEIYAWNAVLDQTVLKPGEQVPFKSRLASPPAEGRNIDIRFFNRRDVTGGSA
jgi:predicted Zn finger-like uncharacterized protein